jgi:hypothetical protein
MQVYPGGVRIEERERRAHTTDALLHVTNGDSTAEMLRRTPLAGPVLAWRDALHEGPVPFGDEREVRAARARFLVEAGWSRRPEEVVVELEQRDRALLEALTERREVVLWFEHDLYDQLQLVQALALIVRSGVPTDGARLICIGKFEGRPSFAGLGELNEYELASLWPLRRRIQPETLAAAIDAWDAFRRPDPHDLEALTARQLPGLDFLAAALVRLLEELPAVGDGLGRTERQLLEALAGGPTTPLEAFIACGRAEETPFLGDSWAWLRLYELTFGNHPLLTGLPLPPPRGDAATFRAALIELTEVGRAVLEGRADRVAAVGIDRWLGGVHVTGCDPWRWDRESRRVVARGGR